LHLAKVIGVGARPNDPDDEIRRAEYDCDTYQFGDSQLVTEKLTELGEHRCPSLRFRVAVIFVPVDNGVRSKRVEAGRSGFV